MKKISSQDILHALNILIAFLLFLYSMFFVLTFCISKFLFLLGFLVNTVLVLFYQFYKKDGRFKKIIVGLRILLITITVSAVLAPITVIGFRHTKILYPVKNLCYNYGVYGKENDIMPLFLPKKCDDYMFITIGSFPAPDHHASAYLAFHTDTETLGKYEDNLKALEKYELSDITMPLSELNVDKELQWEKCPEQLPKHVFARLQPEHIHDFEDAVLYKPSSNNRGCMIDYDSGFVVFWY